MTESGRNIRAKAMCLLMHEGKVLVSRGYDEAKGERFHRVLGGTVHFGERSEDAVRREIREELGSELANLKLLDVVENIFTYNGEPGHQITFLFAGELARRELYDRNPIHIVEDTYEFDAEWVPVERILSGEVVLYPSLEWARFL